MTGRAQEPYPGARGDWELVVGTVQAAIDSWRNELGLGRNEGIPPGLLKAVEDGLSDALGKLAEAGRLRTPEQEGAEPLNSQRDRLVEAIGRSISLPPEHIARIYGVGYRGSEPKGEHGV